MSTAPYNWIEQFLETTHKASWYRFLQTIQNYPSVTIEMEERSLLNFASNNYLGLAEDDRLIQPAVAAT